MLIGRKVIIYEGLKSEKYHIFVPIGAVRYAESRKALRIPIMLNDGMTRIGTATRPRRQEDGAITMKIDIDEQHVEWVKASVKEEMYEFSAYLSNIDLYDIDGDRYLWKGTLRQITFLPLPGIPKSLVPKAIKKSNTLKRGLRYAKNK